MKPTTIRPSSTKTKIIILVIVFIVAIFAGVLSYYLVVKNNFVNNLKMCANQSDFAAEYGDKINYETLRQKYLNEDKLNDEITFGIFVEDTEIKTGEEYIFEKVGENQLKIELTSNFKTNILFINIQQEVKVSLSSIIGVADTHPPIIDGVSNKTIFVGQNLDLKSGIHAYDVVDGDLDITITGEVNINATGVYELIASAVDKNNNQTSISFKITVQEKVIENRDGAYYINGILVANKTYALSSTYAPGGLLGDFNDNFNNMKSAAKNDGISLWVASGYRSYSHQNNLYNKYVRQSGQAEADTYSARPGHSEHQTGLAADINQIDQNFINTSAGKWLNDNCYKYGFIIRYPKGKESITGYIYEPWHIRYVGVDVATKLYNNGDWITLEEYLGIDSVYK